MSEDDRQLRAFVKESNRIEGITRAPTKLEIAAHAEFLALESPTVADLQAFVLKVARRTIRDIPGIMAQSQKRQTSAFPTSSGR
jgi:hypothetical protein